MPAALCVIVLIVCLQLTLYDTAGMERFEGTIPPTYFRHARVVIFVYSITSMESFSDIVNWDESVSPQRMEYVGIKDNLIRVLVGNKTDLEDQREVPRDSALNIAENYDIDQHLIFEISAKDGSGFDEMFEEVVREIRKQSSGKGGHRGTVSVTSRPVKTDKSGCSKC